MSEKFNLNWQLEHRKLGESTPLLMGLAEVELNITELCNRTCSFCPRHDPKIYPNLNLNMSIATVNRIKDQLIENKFKGSIILSGFGESVLNKDIYKIVSILSDFSVEVITNGDTILNGKTSITQLFDSGLTTLTLNNYDNNHQLEKIAASNKQIRLRNNYDDGGNHYEEYGFNNRGGVLWKDNTSVNRPCYVSEYRIVFDWNGEVLLCTHNWNKDIKFGNINKRALVDIWYDSEFLKYRKALYSGDRTISESCKNCNIKGNLIGGEYADIWINSFKA
tara:strand:+ start:2661 stop:3494 length:834 start_codon:yes stop_codon:yes gene_type:complete